ncbi:MAG TPA: formate/nitrite transporter family protein [Verrucomicrobiae bacterium]
MSLRGRRAKSSPLRRIVESVTDSGGPDEHGVADKAQEKEIENRTAPPGEIVYGAVYREGEHELNRSSHALALSGLAAGLSMGFSFISEAFLRERLPRADWTPIVSKLGYAIGFLITILGRQQLFSKNTLTVILPMLNRKSKASFTHVLRLWVIVLAANLLGAFLFALFISGTAVFDKDTRAVLSDIGAETFQFSFTTTFLRAILAGWLIALMIWLLPFAESARVWVISLLAYIVGIGHLPHIVAGATPAFYHVLTGGISFGGGCLRFLLPVCLGNVVGGVAMVAAGVHAEFHAERREKEK